MSDDGRINERILANLRKKDWLQKLESAYLVYPTDLHSPEIKRLYLRFFDVTSLNVHFIQVYCRTKLPHEMVVQAERFLESAILKAVTELDGDIIRAQQLLDGNGIRNLANYLAKPLRVDVRVLSSITNRYLDLFVKTDHLLRILETLQISGAIKIEECDTRRAMLKRQVRRIASSGRNLSDGLRQRLNALSPANGSRGNGLQEKNEEQPEPAPLSPADSAVQQVVVA
jgi:hypothetical protein